MTPICRGDFDEEWQMTDAIMEALKDKGIEVRGWK